ASTACWSPRRVARACTPVGKGRLLIGRAAEGDVRVGDAYTSRRHAAVLASDDGVVIEDLGSVNRLLVNDKAAVKAVLRDGDVVEIGGTCLRFMEYLSGTIRSR